MTQQRSAAKGRRPRVSPQNKDRPRKGQTFIRWADWDGTYRGNVRLQVHESRRECTYGLKPFKVRITVL